MNLMSPPRVGDPLRAALVAALLLLAPPALAHGGANDCGTGADAPFNVFSGAILPSTADCLAHLGGSADERDSYRFEAPPGTRIRIEVIPLMEGHFPNLGLFTPDHDGSEGSTLVDRNDLSRRHLEAVSSETGLWGFYVFLMESPTSTRIAHGDYRVVITLEGEPWVPDAFDGRFLASTPLGSRVGRALGPDAPAELDGLDGDWIPLERPTGSDEFLAISSADCDECLLVAYRVASGSVLDASCQRNGATTYCLPFAGVTHVLVHSTAGREIAFSGLHYHAPAET